MKVSVEISKYPLTEGDFIAAIKDFIARVNTYPNLTVLTNSMSTQVFGEYSEVMAMLTKELQTSFDQYGTSVFVCKFVPGDLNADKIEQ